MGGGVVWGVGWGVSGRRRLRGKGGGWVRAVCSVFRIVGSGDRLAGWSRDPKSAVVGVQKGYADPVPSNLTACLGTLALRV